jgi:hypothetical protein
MSQEDIISVLEKNEGRPMFLKELMQELPHLNKNLLTVSFTNLRKWAEKARNCPVKVIRGYHKINVKDPRGFEFTQRKRITRLVYCNDNKQIRTESVHN